MFRRIQHDDVQQYPPFPAGYDTKPQRASWFSRRAVHAADRPYGCRRHRASPARGRAFCVAKSHRPRVERHRHLPERDRPPIGGCGTDPRSVTDETRFADVGRKSAFIRRRCLTRIRGETETATKHRDGRAGIPSARRVQLLELETTMTEMQATGAALP